MNAAGVWLAAAWAICRKDLQAEFRTRYALGASGLFAIVTLTVTTFALGPLDLSPGLLAALLWIVLFFAAMAGLARAFVHEEEVHTAAALRLAAPAGAVYLGKYLFNLLLLLMLEVLVVPLFIGMLNVAVDRPALFLLVLALGNLGLAGTTTAVAAMVAQAGARGALFTVLSFPLLIPLLSGSIAGTHSSLAGASLAEAGPALLVLAAYAVAMVTVSLLVFPAIWTES